MGAFTPQKLANITNQVVLPFAESTVKHLPAYIESRPQGRGWQPYLFIVLILEQKLSEHFALAGVAQWIEHRPAN